MSKFIDRWTPFAIILCFVVIGAIVRFFVKPWVKEALTVAMFVGMIGMVLALAIPGSHLLVAVLY